MRKALEQVDAALTGQPAGDRRWYVTPSGQTMAVFNNPEPFPMGSSPDTDPEPDSGEEKRHFQQIDHSYALATKKVTNEQFQRFRKRFTDKRYSPEPDAPAIGMWWYQAAEYCNWLSQQEGLPESEWCYPKDIKEGMTLPKDYLSRKGYRLPTEAEWECACRAGTVTSRYYGSALDLLPKYAWFQKSSGNKAWPVGQLKPNDFGLFDILGNAWEWCQESWEKGEERKKQAIGTDTEDLGPVTDRKDRITRGGSFTFPG